MRRRELIAGAAFAVAAPAAAQQSTKKRRLAVFSASQPSADMQEHSRNRYYGAIFAELRRLGWREGENLTVERFGKELNTAGPAAEALQVVRSNPDVILSIGPDTEQLKAATTAIPIVAFTGYPIALGLTNSLAHPGGNITGVSVNAGVSIWAKRVELLREAFPAMKRLAFLYPSVSWQKVSSAAVRAACEAARLSFVDALYDPPGSEAGYRGAIGAAVREGADAMMVSDSPDAFDYRVLLTDFIAQARLPAIYGEREFVEAGGLMAYEGDFIELCRRAVQDVDAILRGASAGSIPYFLP
jgi:putative ABC transport system substrate-binding protein